MRPVTLVLLSLSLTLAACSSATDNSVTEASNVEATSKVSWFIVEEPDADGDGVNEIRVTNGRPIPHGGLYWGDDAFRWVRYLSGNDYGPMPTDPNWQTIELKQDYVRFDPATGAFEKHGAARDLTWTLKALASLDADGEPELVLTHAKAVDGTGKNFKHAIVLTNGKPLDVDVGQFEHTVFFGFDLQPEEPRSDGLLGLAFRYQAPEGCAKGAVHHYRYLAAKNGYVVDHTDCLE